MTNHLASLPRLGVGIGFRDRIAKKTLLHRNDIDVVEIITENYFNPRTHARLEKINSSFPVIPHGVELSVGSAQPLEQEFLQNIKTICTLINAPYYSDHFAVTRLGEQKIGHLSPIWFTGESLALVKDKVNRVQDFLGIPLALENITSFFDISHADMREEEFISDVCAQTGCGLLLDITNVHINAYNRKKDPCTFLKHLPLDHVIHIHLAGGVIKNDWFHDTHNQELNGINEGVWPLLEWTLARAPNLKTIIIERDENLDGDLQDMLLNDICRIREINNATHERPQER